MGADIRGVGTDKSTIQGVESLHTTYHEVMPDRLEAAALIMSFVMTDGSGTIENTIPEHNQPLLEILEHVGVKIQVESDKIHILASKCYKNFDAETRPYPGLATDIQPILTPLAIKCPGISRITDTVHKERFSHADELIKCGADIKREGNTIILNGDVSMHSGVMVGKDIRSVVGLINASLAIKGDSVVYGIEHLIVVMESLLKS